MRWDRLFDDLEGQLAAQHLLERDAEVADRTRRKAGPVDAARPAARLRPGSGDAGLWGRGGRPRGRSPRSVPAG